MLTMLTQKLPFLSGNWDDSDWSEGFWQCTIASLVLVFNVEPLALHPPVGCAINR
jgi:hypothetical protein